MSADGARLIRCEELPPHSGPVHLDAYEVDVALAAACRKTLQLTQRWLAGRGTGFTFTVHQTDFVTRNASALDPGLFDVDSAKTYDLAISNPPYFKLRKTDLRAVAASSIVHGQPNIYALFMAITASLLGRRGVMVTITPRSFATGDYFRRFRQHFLSAVVPEAVHLFHSRKEAFKADTVLQENVIIRSRRTPPSPASRVTVSTSSGVGDIQGRRTRQVPLEAIVDLKSCELTLHIPTDRADDEVVRFVGAWPCTLHKIGLEVSTGPVVAFRARQFLARQPSDATPTAPLLWLQNVRRFLVEWPIPNCGKPQYIADSVESRPLLVPNLPYVVLRRFTAKEESRRLTAAPILGGVLPGKVVGLENHLNYVHRPHGRMDDEQTIGIAAVLGSRLLDRFFRVSNGNTQVNATEVRGLPLPSPRALSTIGREMLRGSIRRVDTDAAIEEILQVPRSIARLIEDARDGQG